MRELLKDAAIQWLKGFGITVPKDRADVFVNHTTNEIVLDVCYDECSMNYA